MKLEMINKLRLFIAVPIEKEAANQLEREINSIKKRTKKNVRFIPQENWHFTLVFLGDQKRELIPEIKKSIQKTTESQKFELPKIEIEKINYGPPGRTARMIWAIASYKTSAALGKIKKDLEKNLEGAGIKWQKEERTYNAHITIARFNPYPLSELPKIEKAVNVVHKAISIDLLKSELTKEGAKYKVLYSSR